MPFPPVDRRRFLRLTTAATAGAAMAGKFPAIMAQEKPVNTTAPAVTPSPDHLPRWRGFNLLEKFTANNNAPCQEEDFAWLQEWGFDFVRLPLSYLCSTDPNDWLKLKDGVLKDIDQAVEFGAKYGIHVNLNFHRIPGYCVNPPKEPLDIWKDDAENTKALDAAAFHWGHFAQRYKGIPNSRVSFDLINEPGAIPEPAYVRVVKRLVEAIHAADAQRLIIADGLKWGNDPVFGLVELKVGQSTRGYAPMQISHYKASWIGGSDKLAAPTWPLKLSDTDVWDRERLRQVRIEPWKKLEARGVGIHVGEWGAFQYTPHDVALAWMKDSLELWQEAGWGWSLWNLRGGFGIVDTNRPDVKYEDFHGHKLDRAMLELLRAH